MFRFGAAFWVLLLHFSSTLKIVGPAPVSHFMINGFYAMSFFFVLSGVVLTYSYAGLGSTVSELKRFYLARFSRIYPSYAVILVIGLFSLPIHNGAWEPWLYTHVMSALGIQAWMPHTFIGANAATWSISCEFFFYALFPALLPVVRHLSTRQDCLRAAVYLSLFIGFLGLSDFAFGHEGTFPLVYISPLFRLPEFILGMVVGSALLARDHTRPLPRWIPWTAGAVFLLISTNQVYRVGLPTRANILVVPAVAWLLYAAAAAELSRPRLFSHWPSAVLLYLGRASFGMFLGQIPILALLVQANGTPTALGATLRSSPIAAMIGCILSSMLVGIALHELVEKPVRGFLLRRATRTTPPIAA